MTELRKRMIECLQLRGFSERTQEACVRAVGQLAQHYKKSPDLVTEEKLRQYFLYIKNVKKYSRPTTTIALCGIKFFFERTLGKQWTSFDLIRPPREKKPPAILGVEEVRKILLLIRLPRYRVGRRTAEMVGPSPRRSLC
ncbi:MAG: site-specific integrase [Blastocatellia bacterium]